MRRFSYWFDKLGPITEGNTYHRYTASSSPLRGNPTQARDVARRISGAVAGESAQKSTYQVPITNPYLPHYIICHLPLVFLSPTSPLVFYSPSLFRLPLFRLLVVMASPLSTPLSPEFEVFHFKQRQGENLKDAWFRMMESYRNVP